MPAVIDVSKTDDPRDVVHRTVQALAEGKLVVFPTETVYGVAASALNEPAVERLAALRGSAAADGLTLVVRSYDEALDYAPHLSPLAQRLARRCWPGPLTLVVEDSQSESLVSRLPPSVQTAVNPRGTVALRVPAHSLIQSALRLAVGPLLLTKVSGPTDGFAVSAQEVLSSVGDDVALVLDDGRTRFAAPSSVVRVRGREIEVTRTGVLNEATLMRLSSLMILFVCTGNTCRSPMAEVLMRRRAAERMGCSMQELADRGVLILSAGIAAMSGSAASAEAHEAVTDRGLDLRQHESQPVTDRLIRFADMILTMTRGHREAVLAQWPDAAPRTRLLSRSKSDVSDPIGGPLELYRRCADQIDGHLAGWEQEIAWDEIPVLRSSRTSDQTRGS